MWSDPAYPILHQHEKWYSLQETSPFARGTDPTVSYKTWDQPAESLEDAEARIHDSVPREMLHTRAETYVDRISRYFPHAMPAAGSVILEIGSGVAYIMEAANRRFQPRAVIGLDVAPAMVAKAQQRLARDHVKMPAEFILYDGVTIPIKSRSVDLLYSVACLQHIPKPYAYHLFDEMSRILKNDGFAALHFMSFSAVRIWQDFDFRAEVFQQLRGTEGHWHHFYSAEELFYVLESGYGAANVMIEDPQDGTLWASFGPKKER